jgi:hypothetical protein
LHPLAMYWREKNDDEEEEEEEEGVCFAHISD